MKKLNVKIDIFIKALKSEPDLSFIDKLIKAFPKAEIYLVGGAVRDIILKRRTKDYDFVVRHLKPKELEKFLANLGQVNLVGKSFGVFKFVPKKSRIEAIDIALPRTEHSRHLTGGYKDFKVQSDPSLPIEKDLSRRDFTINAMAFDLKNKKLIDPMAGLSDLAAEKIRAVGKPELRFKEDYSRILRALRFAVQLDFSLENNTWSALKKLIIHLEEKTVAREVIAKELLKTFKFNPVKALDLISESGALKILMPEVAAMKNTPQPPQFHFEGDVFIHTRLALEKLNSPPFLKFIPDKTSDLEVIIGVLFHDIGKVVTMKTPAKDGTDRIRFNRHDGAGAEIAGKIIDRLKLESTGEIKKENVVWLVGRHMLLIIDDPYDLKANTIEKLFFNPKVPGQKLLKVILADILASLPKNLKPNTRNIKRMLSRIEEFKAMDKKKKSLPPPLINGNDLIRECGLRPGPLIGELLAIIREKQLTKKIKTKAEGLKLIKDYLK
ncbi:MAG: HD domain-containing protein [Patescibacteria group bacterium]